MSKVLRYNRERPRGLELALRLAAALLLALVFAAGAALAMVIVTTTWGEWTPLAVLGIAAAYLPFVYLGTWILNGWRPSL